MDEKHSTQTPRGMSTPKAIQSPPAQTNTANVSPKTSGETDARNEKSGVADSSASSTSRTEAAKQSDGVTAVLKASRVELDRLLTETQSLHERSWRVIHTLLEDSQLRASQAVDACLARFEQEIQDRVSSEIATTLQNLDIEVDARLAARLDQALATAKQRQSSIERDLVVAIAENRKQLDQMCTGAAERLQQREQSLMGDLQKEAEKQLGELAKNANQISNSIQRIGDGIAAGFKQRTEEAVQVFQSRIEQVWQEAIGRAEKQIAGTAHSCVVELTKQAREVVDREMSEFLNRVLRQFDRSSEGQSSNHTT